jgi:hypothetical protein
MTAVGDEDEMIVLSEPVIGALSQLLLRALLDTPDGNRTRYRRLKRPLLLGASS